MINKDRRAGKSKYDAVCAPAAAAALDCRRGWHACAVRACGPVTPSFHQSIDLWHAGVPEDRVVEVRADPHPRRAHRAAEPRGDGRAPAALQVPRPRGSCPRRVRARARDTSPGPQVAAPSVMDLVSTSVEDPSADGGAAGDVPPAAAAAGGGPGSPAKPTAGSVAELNMFGKSDVEGRGRLVGTKGADAAGRTKVNACIREFIFVFALIFCICILRCAGPPARGCPVCVARV